MSVSPKERQDLLDRMAKVARPPEIVRQSQERLWHQMQSLVRSDEWATLQATLESLRDEQRMIYDGYVLELSSGIGPSDHLVTAIRAQWRDVQRLNMILDLPAALASKAQAMAEKIDTGGSPVA